MNDSADRNVVVKLEVSVPVGSGAHVMGVAPSLDRVAAGPPINNLGVLNVSYPTTNQNGVPVKTSGSSNQGVICAGGTSIDSSNRPGKFILAKVFPNAVSGTPDATGATVAVPDMYGRWSINNLGTAACSAGSGSVLSTLVVWAQFIDPGADPDIVRQIPFFGVCGTATLCDNTFAAPILHVGNPPVLHEEQGPREWRVIAAGFDSAQLKALNKRWIVKLLPTQGSTSVWDNGGNGGRTPRVALCYERGCAPVWKLQFLLGEAVIEYVKPAAEWNIVDKNVFTSVSSSGLPAGSHLPATIEVVPA